MKCTILHDLPGRMRVHLCCKQMTLNEADVLEYYLLAIEGVKSVKVYDRTQDAIVVYDTKRESIIRAFANFAFDKAEKMNLVPEHTSRALNREFEDKLGVTVIQRCISNLFLPVSITSTLAIVRSLKYIKEGLSALLHGKLSVAVLDGTAVTVSIVRGDFNTAGSVMFMLRLGEILEEWTHKKSVADLASAMSLRVDKVWIEVDYTQVLTDVSSIIPGDRIVVRTGGMIPLDGKVVEGEALVNESSLTGESMPVNKRQGSPVYAGTVVEEGECIILVEKATGEGRYDRVVRMIEESEKLKSTAENKASRTADKLVPYTLGGTVLTYLLTQNTIKMLAVLMVDFSCALKLAIPIAVLSAMRESSDYHISVKGGRFLEAVAKADTIVFDKTGTLTNATPTVAKVIPFDGHEETEMLRLAACLEEHYPHSMANAVVEEAKKRGLTHDEYHSEVRYVVAHGISSMVEDKKVLIGSAHFVFEDEGCQIPEGEKSMTGDNRRTAEAIAKEVGVDKVYAEVLPEDKANFIREEKGHTVIMVGDGVNDSPALSEADTGIAISTGAAIAREIADITIASEDLYELATLRKLSEALMNRIYNSHRFIIGFNLSLITLGVAGILPPTTSALLHNGSTLGISLKNMTNLLPESNKSQMN